MSDPDATARISMGAEDDCPLPFSLSAAESFVQDILSHLGLVGWELSITFCRDAFIADLNSRYRHIEGATDVLSFTDGGTYTDESGEARIVAGDIVISVDTLLQNCREFNVPQNEELKRLLVHGILHLAGHDHENNEPEQKMLTLQEEILLLFQNSDIMGEK